MADTEKLNIDSIIARLLEGWLVDSIVISIYLRSEHSSHFQSISRFRF